MNDKTQLPSGVRDFLFEEARTRRWVENMLAGVFEEWGYREVITPTLEYLETVLTGTGTALHDEIYKLIDRQGRILALRPDMTTPVARLAATRLSGLGVPLRLYYRGSIFRFRPLQKGHPHEMQQAGIELIGVNNPAADAEVIAVALEGLRRLGLRGLRVGIGHAGFLQGIMEEAGLGEEQRGRLRRALAARDYVGYEGAVNSCTVSAGFRQVLLDVTAWHGAAGVIKSARRLVDNPRAREALDNLEETLGLLELYGNDREAYVDLGMVRDLEYYTGVIFEGYAPGMGRPLCGGGRYDLLLEEFGWPCAATGFAMALEEIAGALQKQGTSAPGGGLDYLLVPSPGQEKRAYRRARELRQQGRRVEVEVAGLRGEALASYAAARGVREILMVGEE